MSQINGLNEMKGKGQGNRKVVNSIDGVDMMSTGLEGGDDIEDST